MSTRRSSSSAFGTRQLSTDERRRIRLVKYKAQSGLCAICTQPLGAERAIDHIVPVSKGGKNIWSNYQLTHDKCNKDKSDA